MAVLGLTKCTHKQDAVVHCEGKTHAVTTQDSVLQKNSAWQHAFTVHSYFIVNITLCELYRIKPQLSLMLNSILST